jgi:hypothetical protein
MEGIPSGHLEEGLHFACGIQLVGFIFFFFEVDFLFCCNVLY